MINKQKILEETNIKIKQKLENSDQKIIYYSLIIDKLIININELYEQIKILTNLIYPTLDKYVTIEQYCNICLMKEINEKNLKKINISLENIENILEIINSDVGITLNEDKEIIEVFIKNILNLIDIKKNFEQKIEKLFIKNYINFYNITSMSIAIKMLQRIGSIDRLSKMPSSTIQLIGAEKSFFKALKNKKNTPKYGYIYNHPLLIKVSKKNKGKFARYLAGKINIAIKADICKENIYEQLNKKIENKMKTYE